MCKNPCKECPFKVENAGQLCHIMVDQMEDNAQYLKGFPCHMKNPNNDILTCESPAQNANDCSGFKRMRENQMAGYDVTLHPDVVSSFDELMNY